MNTGGATITGELRVPKGDRCCRPLCGRRWDVLVMIVDQHDRPQFVQRCCDEHSRPIIEKGGRACRVTPRGGGRTDAGDAAGMRPVPASPIVTPAGTTEPIEETAMTTTATQNVTVYGPNLPKALQDQGTLHVHVTGCADTKRGALKALTDKDEWGFDADSIHAIVTNCYPPEDFQYDAADPEEYAVFRSDVHVAPCVTLPEQPGIVPVAVEELPAASDTDLDPSHPDYAFDRVRERLDRIAEGHPSERVDVPTRAERRAAKRDARAAAKKARGNAGTNRQKESNVSTKSAMKAAGIDPKVAKMTAEQLREEAARLNIEGRSKLTKRADLEKAIAKAKAAKQSSKPKASTNGDRPTVAAHGDLKPGTKVRVVRNVDLTARAEGFAGVVESGTEGTVKELRQSGGGGVQVVFESKDLGEVAMGARHFEVV